MCTGPRLSTAARLFLLAFFSALLAGVAAAARQAAQESFPVFGGGLSATTGLLLDDNAVVALIQESSGDLARDTVARLSLWHRVQVTDGYAAAAAWMAERAKEVGLRDVTIERFPSDGKTEYFGSGTEPLWIVKRGELWITRPIRLKVTSYDEMPMSLARNSTTAEAEADIVDVGEGLAERDYPADVKGKIVLASGTPSVVVARAVVERGAAGVITSWSVPDVDRQNRWPGDHPEQVGESRIQAPAPGQPGRFAFLVSARRAEEIKNLLRRGPVRAHASVVAELGPGTLDVVTGVIPGARYPNEEVVISAHLDHYKPGANDNASGSSAILEIARTVGRLVAAGRLPAPLRTVRFMWVPEYNGTRAWFSKHLGDGVKRVAELNLDMVGENVKTTNAVFAVSYLPDAFPSFLNALTESAADFVNRYADDRYGRRPEFQALSLTGSRDRINIRMVPYMTGTDHELFNNAGIPGTTLGVFPDDYYHSSGDSVEQVDATQLHRAAVFGLIGLTTAAYADDAQAGDLASLALLYGRRRLAAAESEALRGLMAASKNGFQAADSRATALMPHVYRRERAAVASSALFARTEATRQRIDRMAALIDQDQPLAWKRVDEVAAARAGALGVTRGTPAQSEADARAGRLVPSWVAGKQLTDISAALAKAMSDPAAQAPKIQAAIVAAMSAMRATGESELRIMGMPNAPATWVDGRRTLLDISQAIALEYAPIPTDALEMYFRAFEKAGAMKIAQK